MTTLHPHHGAYLSELRSLGFTTRSCITAGGNREHLAVLREGQRCLIVLLPYQEEPGALLDFNHALHTVDPRWVIPAECFSDVIRDHLSGTEVARMHGPDCVCIHPDAR